MANKYKIEKDMKESIKFYQKCVKCERCYHTVPLIDKQKGFCDICGRYIFKNKRDEFFYRLSRLLKKGNINEMLYKKNTN